MFERLFNKDKEQETGGKAKLLPLFDRMENINDHGISHVYQEDFEKAHSFLKSYVGSLGTFNAYRRELERLLQWCGLKAHKSLKELTRDDMEDFIKFCQKPPKSWIGLKKVPRFVVRNGVRVPNPSWRPFVVRVTKAAFKHGERPQKKEFSFLQTKDLFAILNSFFNYLIQENYVQANPISLIRQKSKYIRTYQAPIRRLTEVQWQCVLDTADRMAAKDPGKHERTYFILSILYSLYLRISELTANKRWTPEMRHFYKDPDGNWWFATVGKGNKHRDIAVSDTMLEALKRWRTHLGLSPLPNASDKSPLIPKLLGQGPITHTNHIRRIVQECFGKARVALEKQNKSEEADSLMEATVHWLRHTGISDDVKIRPREHVRDDAGHSSSAITDRYIDIERKERHNSAKNKRIR